MRKNKMDYRGEIDFLCFRICSYPLLDMVGVVGSSPIVPTNC